MAAGSELAPGGLPGNTEGIKMALKELATEPRIQRVITHPEDDNALWQADLERFLAGDARLTRRSAGESAIKAVQRLMIFLGYSTASSGACLVDGDFGRGTNRGLAQFQVEHGLALDIDRATLCYPCLWNTARRLITSVPDCTLSVAALQRMAALALERADTGQVMTGSFEGAIFHLNALHKRLFLDCRELLERYGEHAAAACEALRDGEGIAIRPEWVLAIIKQESSGIIRPRFEQHYLSRLAGRHPEVPLHELRMRSMSLGLGQIMGENYGAVDAASATELYTAPVAAQVAFVARFLRPKRAVVRNADPGDGDFRAVARFYNGPGYESHRYHEGLARWFREFRLLM
jgi:hypothetical protein